MNNFLIVLQKEYMTIVGKKSFIIMTFLTPVLMILLGAVPALLGVFAKDTSDKEVIIVDQTGKYYDAIKDGEAEGFHFMDGSADISEYKSQALSSDSLYAVVVITKDLLEDPRAITIYSTATIPPALQDNLSKTLSRELQQEKIASYQIPELDKIIADSKVSVNISTVQWSADGEEVAASATVGMITGQIFNFALYFFVIMYGSMVMESVRVEKKNRIMEILATSVKPTTLLWAKIVGIGLVGITQLLMWGLFFVIVFVALQSLLLSSVTFDMNQFKDAVMAAQDGGYDAELAGSLEALANINYGQIIFCFLCYFITSYVSFAALYAASGAVTDAEEGVNQITLPITILLVFGFIFGFYSAENPNTNISLITSFIPFMAPNVMMVRLPFNPPTWQIWLSISIMIAFTCFFVWYAAKIFRVGMLMYGKKPTMKELWRWIKYE